MPKHTNVDNQNYYDVLKETIEEEPEDRNAMRCDKDITNERKNNEDFKSQGASRHLDNKRLGDANNIAVEEIQAVKKEELHQNESNNILVSTISNSNKE